MNISTRIWSTLPFILALVVLAYLGWSAINAYSYPHDGIDELDPNNIITALSENSPNEDVLQVGDEITGIRGEDWGTARPHYSHLRSDQTVQIQILRDGRPLTVEIRLVEPTLEERIDRLAPLMVSLVFWSVGVGIQLFMPAGAATNIYFLFFQVTAILLVTGVNTWIGPPWSLDVYRFLQWFIGPLSVQFHLFFPQRTRIRGGLKLAIGLYSAAGIGWLPYLLVGYQELRSSDWFEILVLASQFFIALNFIVVVGILVNAYRTANTPGVRSKIRIVVLGGGLSLIPITLLYIIPFAIWNQYFLPYASLFLFVSILPITYGYAIFRHRLIEIERHVNRGATYILVYTILGSFYLILYGILNRGYRVELVGEPLVNTVLVLLMATAFVPLHRFIQKLVDEAFYGSSYDYRSAVMEITQGFELIDNLNSLARIVGQRLVNTLRVQDVCVFLRNHEGEINVLEVSPPAILQPERATEMVPLPRSSLDFLLKVGQNERTSLREALTGVELTPEEHELLNTEQVHLWVPIIGHGQVQGLIALGPKYGGDIFSGEDLDILRVVARQVGPLVENIHLVAGLEQKVDERTAQLHDEKERAEAILASVGDGVFVTDLSGKINKVNKVFLEQTGYLERELSGVEFTQLLADENSPDEISALRDTLAAGQVWGGELVASRKLGRQYDIHLTMAPVRDQSGRTVSYVGSQRDITSQKELDRMKDQFVSDVSHELRTPTTNISLYLELLENAPPEKTPDYLDIIRDQGKQLRKLVEDILDLSRLSMIQPNRTEFAPIDINVLASQVVASEKAMANVSGLILDFFPGEEVPPFMGIENQIKRVLTNLVSNSVRYTPSGRIDVRTSCDCDHITIEIQDTGMGIDPDDLPHLFERFYRGRRVRQTRIYGTGLGLAIVKEIIELHKGSIEVDSEINKGTMFRIKLPV